MPKVSIVLPVYNAQETIVATIQSIEKQTYKDWELIIVDDGSKDNSPEICDEYSKYEKIKVHHIENSGPSSARNYGLDKCTGEYIMFIDADDMYKNDTIEKMIKAIEEYDYDVVCCNYIHKYGNKEKAIKIIETIEQQEEKEIYKTIEYLQDNLVYNVVWNKLYKNEIIKNNNIKFDVKIDMAEDYRFNNLYFRYVKSIKVLEEALYIHVLYNNTISSKYRDDEFERRIGSLLTNEELYIQRDFPIGNLYNKYVQAVVTSIETIMSKKSNLSIKIQLQKVQQFINHPKIVQAVNMDAINRNIYTSLIKNNKVKMLYIFVWLRTQIKKIVYFLKGKTYRR